MTVLNEQNTMQMLQYIRVFLSKQQDSLRYHVQPCGR